MSGQRISNDSDVPDQVPGFTAGDGVWVDDSGQGGRSGLPKEYHEAVNEALVALLASEWEVVEGPNDFKLKKMGDPPSAGKIASVPKREGRDEFQRRIAGVLVAAPWMLETIEEFVDTVSIMDESTLYKVRCLVKKMPDIKRRLLEIRGGAL